MSNMLGAAVVAALLAATPAMAQTAPAPSTAPSAATAGVVATTNNPNLAVATVKLESGQRLSKIIGAAVYNEGNDQVGTVDDLVMTGGDKVTMAIVSVGGFLGLGSKLVAVPWSQMREDGGKTILAGATKDMLNGMPSFQY